MNRFALALAATAGLLWGGQATAADSLMGPLGDKFTVFHMYARADGKTVVEEAAAMVAAPNPMTHMLFSGAAKNTRVFWLPDGFAMPKTAQNSHEYKAQFTLVLQGELIVEVSDGKEYRLKPGNVLLSDDPDGRARHWIRCEADKQAGCVQVTVAPEDPDKYFANVTRAPAPAN